MAHDLAPPSDWQAFERLCLDLFRELWNAPGAMRHGRDGQPQAGVDIFGLPSGSAEWFGVQCKKKLGTEVTEEELEAELEKAKGFNPKLTRFVLATTARCDAKIQEVARRLTVEGPFQEVLVYDWDHLCADLTGRTELLRKHFPDHFAGDPSDLRSHYLRHLMTELDVVQVSKVSRDQKQDIPLSKVYIDLDVMAEVRSWLRDEDAEEEVALEPSAGAGDRNPTGLATSLDLLGQVKMLERICLRARHEAQREEIEDFSRRCTALEAVATAPRRVLVGRGGSGKSTFGRYLCLCLAGQLLGHETLNLRHLNGRWADMGPELWPWPHGELVPFFVELRRFVRSEEHFPAKGEDGQAKHLVAYLATLGAGGGGEMAPMVRGALDTGALVVLDGLDETPAAEQVRERLQQVIRGFVKTYPDCRVLVTSRPYAYELGQDWRLDGETFDDQRFVDETLAPLDKAKIERFVTDAYAAFAKRNRLDDANLVDLASDLLRQIHDQPSLRRLAEQPLTLTMMTDLHTARGGRLPPSRAKLFEESVCLLLDRWNERRLLEESVTTLVGMDEEQIRSALELLAFRTHRDGGSAGTGDDLGAEIPESALFQALIDTRERYGNKQPLVPEEIRDYLHQRSGILIGESSSVYRFPHRFFQEYLAACHLEHFPDKRRPLLETNPGLWREVVLFLAGRLIHGDGIWTLLRELVGEPPGEGIKSDDSRFLRALLAGLAIREHRLWQREDADHQPKIDRVRDWLRRAVELGALEVQDRVLAGQILGLLGDDRPGIGLGAEGLPAFEWVEIPRGTFTMGGDGKYDGKPVHEEHVEAFRISRYPVTNAQYESFVADGGYTKRWQGCWTESGWEWREEKKLEGPFSEPSPFDLPNHPRVSVSWYEAVAFCNWLASRTGIGYRLPTESEWERSARGTDGREYPWGTKFDPALCNTAETEIDTTTAVGLFPDGESPNGIGSRGILDASGNVWEWCSTKWGDNYDALADDDLQGSAGRVVRGGSFAGDGFFARCAFRSGGDPDIIFAGSGFRLVAPFESL
ncbi:MAG: SUMF1/EgtB/PvdO family nonheme iron enzyme [Acidobacteria bacterium]|nr:SUMF1/EgtB/PvdO family nonheme iron enzyme [Acidobacteriota bacterium]